MADKTVVITNDKFKADVFDSVLAKLEARLGTPLLPRDRARIFDVISRLRVTIEFRSGRPKQTP